MSLDESRRALTAWGTDEATGLRTLNTHAYRVGNNVAVLGVEGFTLTLSGHFAVSGCAGGEPRSVEALMNARFGATFYADPTNGELVRATCNACG